MTTFAVRGSNTIGYLGTARDGQKHASDAWYAENGSSWHVT